MTHRPYPSYKDSGVEWLGEVPEHWEVKALGKISTEKCDGPFGSGITSEHYTDTGALVVRLQNIKEAGFVNGEPAFINLEYFEKDLFRHNVIAGDLLLAGLGDDNNLVGRACVAPIDIEPALVKADCFRFRIDRSQCFAEFVARYLCISARWDSGILATGSTRSRIPLSIMATRLVPVPSLPEQKAITTFLDRETAKIDELVAEQERLIELLTEKRQTVISHAVTRGLDPSVPLKDSGVEWLGQVPEHWGIRRLRQIARLESGHTPSRQHPEWWIPEECTIPWISLSDVWQLRDDRNISIIQTSEKVSPLGLENSSARLLPAGTVILSRTASVGFSGIMAEPMATTQDFVNWICGEILVPEYLLFVLRAMRSEFHRITMGSTHQTIYMPDVEKFTTPLPSVSEQRKIVEHIIFELERFDTLMAEARRGIDLLKERRTALISAAVTGKIDLRESA